MILPSIVNETFGKLAQSIQTQLFDIGYNLIVCNTSYDTDLEERALNTFLTKKVDAVIAIPSKSQCIKLEEIIHSGIPVILVDRMLEGIETDSVIVDNYRGQYETISYLIRMGHKRIGYIDRMIAQSHSVKQRQGYLDALRDNKLDSDSGYIANADGYYYEAGINAVQTLMRQCAGITAIACYYDPIAFGAVRGLIDLGYRVPDDVSVVGYDNMLFTAAMWPALTTVETPVTEMAGATCELLKRRLELKKKQIEKPDYRQIVLPPKLIIRDSVRRIDEDKELKS
jgi:DNA-binding LacI/PurR family transcriptional regulator